MKCEDLFSICGKKILLTGGTRGLGYALAEGFLNAGAEVLITGTSDKVFDAAKRLETATGGSVHGLVMNLENTKQIPDAYEQALACLGGQLDVLVNCAGIQYRCAAAEFPLEAWDRIIRVNLSAVFQLSQLAAGTMFQRGGKIINIASMTSCFGSESIPAYTASKGGIMQLTKALSNEWAGQGIQVNAIAPGYMETELTASMKAFNPRQYEEVTGRIPMHRWGKAEDLQGLAIFLSSSASDYITGAIIPVDGGYLGK